MVAAQHAAEGAALMPAAAKDEPVHGHACEQWAWVRRNQAGHNLHKSEKGEGRGDTPWWKQRVIGAIVLRSKTAASDLLR